MFYRKRIKGLEGRVNILEQVVEGVAKEIGIIILDCDAQEYKAKSSFGVLSQFANFHGQWLIDKIPRKSKK